jgi:hypothetical protein
VLVNKQHVAMEVRRALEAISRNGAIASLILAQVALVIMSVESMAFTLVSAETGSRGEPSSLARFSLAEVGLQVRINIFATRRQ